jgi:hypothetical protein
MNSKEEIALAAQETKAKLIEARASGKNYDELIHLATTYSDLVYKYQKIVFPKKAKRLSPSYILRAL